MIPTRTLARFVHAQEKKFSTATGELSDLIISISLGVKLISQMVATAGFKGLYGYSGRKNVSGDETHLLDEEADEVLVELLGSSGHFGLLVSEERDSALSTEVGSADAKYVVAFDPLDGSSNIGSNIPVGTIFCIFRKKQTNRPAETDDFLQNGRSIVAAGYSVYGAKTSFVYSAGSGVHGFTLDPSIGEFILTDELITVPRRGAIFSVNEGNTRFWDNRMKQFVAEVKSCETPSYSGRYVGSLVVDFDRTLRRGGIFLYPRDARRPAGRLRLLYECMPLAYIMEQGGGSATNGDTPILEVVPQDIHERSAFVTGGPEEMTWFQSVMQG